jgi:hypothetical protein
MVEELFEMQWTIFNRFKTRERRLRRSQCINETPGMCWMNVRKCREGWTDRFNGGKNRQKL